MLSELEVCALLGHGVLDERGKAVGYAADLFEGEADQPAWIGVLTGTLRIRRVLVPAAGAERVGASLRVPWPRARIRQAPRYGNEDRRGLLGLGEYRLTISTEKERVARIHYGLGDGASG